jgi:hypothetical protein
MGKEHRIPTTPSQHLGHKLHSLEQQLSKLKARLRIPTMPRHDPELPLDATDGEHALHNGVPYYYWDGAWHGFSDPGTLIYVGTYPGDTDTTPDSPPFQNGWHNAGGDFPLLKFAKGGDTYVRMEGAIDGGADGTVVFTLPVGYRPEQSLRYVGALSAGSDIMTIQVDPTGDVTVVARGFVPGSGTVGVTALSTAGGADGEVLTIVSGTPTWAVPTPSVAATTNIRRNTVDIAARGSIDFHPADVISIAAADDAPHDEVDITIGITPGTEGQVLTTVSGDPIWQDPIAPTPPSAVYPSVAADGVVAGAEPEINFRSVNVVHVHADDDPATKVDVEISLTAGGEGQVIKTVGGVPEWADNTQARTLIIQWFGALPGAPGATQSFRVPYVNGVLRQFDLQRITLRVETVGTSGTSISLQKSPSGGGFVATAIGAAAVATGVHEDSETAGLGFVQSGDLVRVNFTGIGAGAQSYTVEMEALEVI